jgi:hypothetical protein
MSSTGFVVVDAGVVVVDTGAGLVQLVSRVVLPVVGVLVFGSGLQDSSTAAMGIVWRLIR